MSRRKILVLVLGLFLLIGSGVVVGLTVVRVQNEKSTLPRPKADCQQPPGCCNRIASGGGFDSCGWSDRGWCTPSQCSGSDGLPRPNCAYNSTTGQAQGPANCNCGLLNKTYCAAPPPPTGGNGASFTATYPTGGVTVDSLMPTFTWTANTTGLSYNCLNVHTDQCQTPISSLSRCPGLSDRSWTETASLQPNTTYYWVIYGQPGWPAPGSGCQSFRTGAGTATTRLACVNKACAVVSGGGNNTEGCQTAGTACTGGTCTNDSGCPTGQVCKNGTCATPTQFFGCVNKTCAVVSGATGNANGCTVAGGVCCSANSDCATDQACDSTKSPNVCGVSGEVSSCWGNEGGNGRCYDCNGDGAINILDFSCFAKKWLENI